MNRTTPRLRRIVRDISRAAAVASAMMLALSIATIAGSPSSAGATGGLQGAVSFRSLVGNLPITSGGSGTFIMALPDGASCPGNATTSPAYKYQTFIVSATVDPAAMTYTGSGPAAIAGSFVSAMYDSTASKWVNKFPAVSPSGLIADAPPFSFAVFTTPMPTLAPGDYKVGYACTTSGATATFWTTQITISANVADTPAGISWSVSAPAPTPTTTTTTTSATTTTTTAATTTTIAAGTTTTTATSSATTTTVKPVTSSTIVQSLAPVTTLPFGKLPVTGRSPMALVFWAVLLLAFGRIAVVLARPVRVLPTTER